ncbi:hypothetical protein CsSME_00023863 [Camellia sinensis var. sinensis]
MSSLGSISISLYHHDFSHHFQLIESPRANIEGRCFGRNFSPTTSKQGEQKVWN